MLQGFPWLTGKPQRGKGAAHHTSALKERENLKSQAHLPTTKAVPRAAAGSQHLAAGKTSILCCPPVWFFLTLLRPSAKSWLDSPKD